MLRQEVLKGASKRKGRRITGLQEISGYDGAGAAEQYLMASGRTYFEDMAFDDPIGLQFDLETTRPACSRSCS